MGWQEHHTQSEQYASFAEEAHRRAEIERTRELYRLAAESEVRVLEALERSKTRTLGITIVNAVTLWFKAGEFGVAEQLAYR